MQFQDELKTKSDAINKIPVDYLLKIAEYTRVLKTSFDTAIKDVDFQEIFTLVSSVFFTLVSSVVPACSPLVSGAVFKCSQLVSSVVFRPLLRKWRQVIQKPKVILMNSRLNIPHSFRVQFYIFSTRFECSFTSSPLVSSVVLNLPHSFRVQFQTHSDAMRLEVAKYAKDGSIRRKGMILGLAQVGKEEK